MRKPAELFDSFYVKKIANLEKENRFLKARLEAYEKSQSNIGNN
jgi:cell shape-determining protein MreC